jgi:hypothetical protein
MMFSVLVAVVPYLGIPRSVDMYIYSGAGTVMFLLLLFSKRSRNKVAVNGPTVSIARQNDQSTEIEQQRTLEVAHGPNEIRPIIEREGGHAQDVVLSPENKDHVGIAPRSPRSRRPRNPSKMSHADSA